MKKLLIFSALFFILFSAVPVYGAEDQFQFQPIVSIPLPTGTVNSTTSLADYLNGVFALTIAVSTILAIVMITFDGFRYMTSDVIGTKKEAVERLRGAFLGLFLILATYLILYIINPNILKLDALTTSLSGLSGSQQTTSDTSSAAGVGASSSASAVPAGSTVSAYSGTLTAGCTLKCQTSGGVWSDPQAGSSSCPLESVPKQICPASSPAPVYASGAQTCTAANSETRDPACSAQQKCYTVPSVNETSGERRNIKMCLTPEEYYIATLPQE